MANGAAAATAETPVRAQSKAKRAKRVRQWKGGGIRFFEWLTDNPPFKTFILLCIIANSAILGYDANAGPTNPYHALIERWDDYFLYVFTAELVLEFLAAGPKRYVNEGWNLFDCVIVAASYMSAIPGITAMRTFRILRVFRLVSNVPQMRRVVEALIGALPGILATVMVLCVVFYIGAVMGTTLFRQDPGFHDLGSSALTLFQLSQFDGWGDTIQRLDQSNPYAWMFLMTFTVISAFAVLNLFIGVIVDAVTHTRLTVSEELKSDVAEIERDVTQIEEGVTDIAEAQEDAATMQKHILEEVRALRVELSALKGTAPPATQ